MDLKRIAVAGILGAVGMLAIHSISLATPETKEQIRERLRQEGKITTISGPETRGRLLYVAGKPLQLPRNAYVKDYVIAVSCSDEVPCPEVPFLRIVRGDSMMEVAERSGKIHRERLAPGEAGTFDFVRQALNN